MLKIIMLILLSSQAFAINPQEGNGGNICAVPHGSEMIYVTAEEANDPKLVAKIPEYNLSPLEFWNEISSEYFINATNLMATKAGKEVRSHFEMLQKRPGSEAFASILLDALKVLQKVYVSGNPIYSYYGDDSYYYKLCHGLKAAIRTDINGAVLLDANSWNKLSLESQKILLIHETIRIFDMFHVIWLPFPIYDDELIRVTSWIYEGMPVYPRYHSKWNINDFYYTNESQKYLSLSRDEVISIFKKKVKESSNGVKDIFLKTLETTPSSVGKVSILSHMLLQSKSNNKYKNYVIKYLREEQY